MSTLTIANITKNTSKWLQATIEMKDRKQNININNCNMISKDCKNKTKHGTKY